MSTSQHDEVLHLRAQLNEKDLELIELREQHVQLAARSQEARANWEAALESKDRAIQQLEEALASRQRAVEQLVTAVQTARQQQEDQLSKDEELGRLRDTVSEAHAKISALKRTADHQHKELEAAHAQLLARDREVRNEQVLLRDLAQAQAARAELQGALDATRRENAVLQSCLVDKEQQVAALGQRHQELKRLVLDLRERVLGKGLGEACLQPSPGALQAAAVQGADLQHAPNTGEGARHQIQDLQQQVLTLMMKLQSRESQARRYKEAAKTFKSRLAEASAAVQQHHSQMSEMRQELSKVQLMVQQLPDAQQGHDQEQDTHRHHDKVDDKDTLMAQLLSDLEQLTTDKAAADQQLSEANRKLAAAEDAASKAQAQLDALMPQLGKHGAGTWAGGTDAGGAAVVKLAALQRRCEDAEVRLVEAEACATDAVRQLELSKVKSLEAQRQLDEANRQVCVLEGRVEEGDRRLSDLRRAVDRHEQRAERAERAARAADTAVADLDRRLKQSESQVGVMERRARDAESRVAELERTSREETLRLVDLESRLKTAQAQLLEATQRAADCELRLSSAERRRQEAEAQVAEVTARAREAERLKTELEAAARAAEAAARQAQSSKEADVAQLQHNLELQRQVEAREVSDLRQTLDRVTRGKAEADARVAELQGQLKQHERHVTAARSSSELALRAGFEDRLRVLEDSCAHKDMLIAQLRESAIAASEQYQQGIDSMAVQLTARSAELSDAQQRFAELEALMQRMMARSVGVTAII